MRKIEMLIEYKEERREVEAILKNLKMMRDQNLSNKGVNIAVGFSSSTSGNTPIVSSDKQINVELIEVSIELYQRRMVILNDKLKFAEEALKEL